MSFANLEEWAATVGAKQPGAHEACYKSTACGGSVCMPVGTRLLLVGDSVVRYMYLSLAYALVHGSENTYDGGTPGRGSLIYERRGWGGWPNFLNGTNALLSPHELCDCHRGHSITDATENRYFSFGGVRITYISYVGSGRLHGNWWPNGTVDLRNYAPGPLFARAKAFAWKQPLLKALPWLVAELQPTVIVMSGAAHHMNFRTTNLTNTMGALARVLHHGRGGRRVVWETPTSTLQGGQRSDRPAAAPHFTDIFDAHELTAGFNSTNYWFHDYLKDKIHFRSRANNFLNWHLLRHLFGARSSGCQ